MPIEASRATHKAISCEGDTRRFQTSILATDTLQSLVELEQKIETQKRATQALKSQALVSPSPTRSLVHEIKTHWKAMEVSLATLTTLWCGDSLVATHVKECLEIELQEGIEDMDQLAHVLITGNTLAGPNTCKVIEIEGPGEDLDHEHTITR